MVAGEQASGVVLAGGALVVAVVVLAGVAEATAYLAAAGRAQAAADGAALAAVQGSGLPASAAGPPHEAARRVALAGGARLITCDCARGRRRVSVEVAVQVSAPVIGRLAPGGVVASAQAELVPRYDPYGPRP